MLKTWVKQADIQDVGAYFAVAHAEEELGDWAENSEVSRRGYMEGYQKLADPLPGDGFALGRAGSIVDTPIVTRIKSVEKERRVLMTDQRGKSQNVIHLGTHGEDYGSWMSNPVFYMVGGLTALAALLAVLSFAVFHISALGILFMIIVAGLLALLGWITWIRRQYAFGGGGMMERVHQTILSYLDYDGSGTLLDVGCGSGALSIRAALTWLETKVVGIDYWDAVYNYSQALCEKNAASEGAGDRCTFRHGDANKLDFPDGFFDAVVSNYVYHNIAGADKQELLLETLRVLKKGGVFALNDDMKPRMYGDMETFAQKLRDMGYEEVRLIDTAREVFGSHRRAAMMMLGESRMLVGRK